MEIGGIEIEDFREYLQIDKSALDDAIGIQSDLFFRVSEAYALACSRRDQYKEDMKQIDASVDLRLREEMTENEIKFTEGKITNMVASHEDHVEAAGVYLDMIEEANILGSLKDAFSQRSYMLRELVELYCVGYYADPDYIKNKTDMRENARSDRLDEAVERKRKKKRKDK